MNVTKKDIAQLAHEVNRAYCKSIGDSSIPKWEDAPDWQKDSILNGVNMHLSNPDATPDESHKNWLKQKEEEGWIYGPVKDVERKMHPCMKPYEELPESQKAKDYIFKAICNFFQKEVNEAAVEKCCESCSK
jgi:hypothetical protein